eukprot:jgi/Picre1/29341/NNA_004731.t1
MIRSLALVALVAGAQVSAKAPEPERIIGNGEVVAGIRDIVEDITAQLRQFFQAHNGKGAARRLNAADGKLLDDAREFLTDAFGNLKNFTQQRAEKLKYTYDEATKDRAIQDIVGDYFPMDLGKDLLDDTLH